MALPAVRLLYDSGNQIDWVCGRAVQPLLECYSWVNLLPIDDRAIGHGTWVEKATSIGSLWRTLVRSRYDLCATLYYDERYKILTLPVRAKRTIMLSQSDRRSMLIPGRHHTDEYARILLQAVRSDGEIDTFTPQSLAPLRPDKIFASPLPERANSLRIVLVPAGARNVMRDDALRRWPVKRYVELAKLLLDRGFEVILAGGPDDHWIDESFVGLSVTNLIGAFSLPELVGLFDETDVVITHDTGPLHLAGITRAGIIGIFGPTNPWEKLPRRNDSVAIWGGEGFACRPCYDGKDFAPCRHNGCLDQVLPAMILRELDRLLERKSQGLTSPARIVFPEI